MLQNKQTKKTFKKHQLEVSELLNSVYVVIPAGSLLKHMVVRTAVIDLRPVLKFLQRENLYAIWNVTKAVFDHWVGKLHDAVLLQMVSKVK